MFTNSELFENQPGQIGEELEAFGDGGKATIHAESSESKRAQRQRFVKSGKQRLHFLSLQTASILSSNLEYL